MKCDLILAASEATTASKQPQISIMTSDLKSVTPITYLSMCILLIWYGHFWQPLRSLQPQRSSLTSDLKSVTPITYLSMCILLIWYGPFWLPSRQLHSPNSVGGQIWPQILNWLPQLFVSVLIAWPFWLPRRPLQSPNRLGGQIWPQILNKWPQWYGLFWQPLSLRPR